MFLDYDALKNWFDQEKRDFPWRKNPTAYSVWVSEVMLQQTRASYVVPYFEKWMKEFPSLSSLAKAPLEKVIKLWEGLGYYQRARNLHKGALQIMQKYKGEIPSSYEELKTIQGIGDYTGRAILAFAFQKREIALDANVKRVFSRLFAIEERIDSKEAQKKLFIKAEALQKQSPHLLAEPFIELGALICQKNPLCFRCPLKESCVAHKKKQEKKYPILPVKKEILFLQRAVFLLEYEGYLLVKKEREKNLMKDLYEFFYQEYLLQSPLKWEKQIEEILFMKGQFQRRLPAVKQGFTRYQVLLYPFFFLIKEPSTPLGFEWVEKKELKNLPFSSGHRKILQQFLV